jgi:hypothetical protein
MRTCSICTLPTKKLDEINAFIRAKMPYRALSEKTGLPVTTLWKHRDHVKAPANNLEPPDEAWTAPMAVAHTPRPRTPVTGAAAGLAGERQESIDRLESLHEESTDVMKEAKRLGDLRSRIGGIRVTREIIESQAELRGLYNAPDMFSGVHTFVVVMMPKADDVEEPAIDIQPVSNSVHSGTDESTE